MRIDPRPNIAASVAKGSITIAIGKLKSFDMREALGLIHSDESKSHA